MRVKGTAVHLDALKHEVQRRFGRPIRTKTDCQNLEDALFAHTGKLVSYNTLRRFFGLIPGGEPRESVLDILCEYCGYLNHEAFRSDARRFKFYFDWTQTIDKDQWTEAERDALLDRIAEEDFNAQTIFLWVLYKLTSSVPIRDWSFWLEHPMWTEGDLRKAQLVFFSNSLADEFRMRLNSPEPLKELQENPMSFRWVTHFFADYETIQTGYMAHVLDVMATRIEVPLYYHGMRIMQHFMGGTWEDILPHAHKSVEAGYDSDAYPILISRYFQARFWVYYLEHGGWDPRLTSDYLRELQRINPEYHHLLGMEFLPIASIMGFTSPVLEILESQLSQIHYRGNWSAAVDSDLIRLAAMLAHARTGARSLFDVHRNSLLMGFWYKAYRKYLQGLYYASTLLIGEPDAEYEAPYRHFPGLARALQN